MNTFHVFGFSVASLLVFNSASSCNESKKNVSKDKSTIPSAQPSDAAQTSNDNLSLAGNAALPCGIYVADDWDKPVEDYVLKNPDVDGVIIRIHWNKLQTEPEKFDWTQMDSDCKKIIGAGKKIWITLAAGKHSPEWIYQKGIRRLDFVESPQEGQSGKIIPVNVPVVWDKEYINLWENLINKLADHLKADQSTWNAITMIKISGINERTDEIRLPAQNELSVERGKSSNAAEIWKNAGYRPELVFKVWQRFLDLYVKNFPGKVISIAVIPGHGFPTIDGQGNIGKRKMVHDLTDDLISDGLKRYKGVFAVQFNSLYDTGGAHPAVVDAGKRGAITGFQLNHVKLADPLCLDNNSTCDEDLFKKVMDNGINHGACWIEIFQKDVLAYPKAIAYGHKKLTK